MLYLFLGLKISSFRGCRFERRQLFPPQLQMTMSAETTLSAHYINPHLRNATGLSIFFQPPLDSPPFFPCLLYVIPQIQQLFFSFLSFFLCVFAPVCSLLGSLFLHPPLLLLLSLFLPVSVHPCHKNELNLSPLVQTTMEWGRLLENKSAFRPFWGCGEGKGGEGCAESRLGTADEEQVGWQSGGCTRLLTCRLHSAG